MKIILTSNSSHIDIFYREREREICIKMDHERVALTVVGATEPTFTVQAANVTLTARQLSPSSAERRIFQQQTSYSQQMFQHQRQSDDHHRNLHSPSREGMTTASNNVPLPTSTVAVTQSSTTIRQTEAAGSNTSRSTSSPSLTSIKSPVPEIPIRYFQSLATLNNLGTSKLKSGQIDDAIDYFDVIHSSIEEIKNILINEKFKWNQQTTQHGQQQNLHDQTRLQVDLEPVSINRTDVTRFNHSRVDDESNLHDEAARSTTIRTTGTSTGSNEKKRRRNGTNVTAVQSLVTDLECLPKDRHELCYLKLDLFLRYVTGGGTMPPSTPQHGQSLNHTKLPSSSIIDSSTRFDASVLLPSTYHKTLCATTEPIILSTNFLNASLMSASGIQPQGQIGMTAGNQIEHQQQLYVSVPRTNDNNASSITTNQQHEYDKCCRGIFDNSTSTSVSNETVDPNTRERDTLNTNNVNNVLSNGTSLQPAIYIDSSDLAGRYEELTLLSFIALYNWGIALYRKSYLCLILADEQLFSSSGDCTSSSTRTSSSNNPTACNNTKHDALLTRTLLSMSLYQLSTSYRARSWARFMSVLKVLETSIGTYRGGDIHFFHAVSVAKLVLRNSIQIAIDNNDTALQLSYTINLQCASTIADAWYTNSIEFWGGSLLQRVLAGAA